MTGTALQPLLPAGRLQPLPRYDVFMSHRQKDAADFCRTLHTMLHKKNAFTVFLDQEDNSVLTDLLGNVKASRILIYVLSTTIFDSPWCEKELLAAHEAGNRIILLVHRKATWTTSADEEPGSFPPDSVIPSSQRDVILPLKADALLQASFDDQEEFEQVLLKRLGAPVVSTFKSLPSPGVHLSSFLKAVEANQAQWELWELLANHGNAHAQMLTAGVYLNALSDGYPKLGFDPSLKRAISWLEESAARNFVPAQALLGGMALQGGEVAQSDERGVTLLKAAAEAGHPTAQCNLGACYLHGRGVLKNEEVAAGYFKKSAAEGEDHPLSAVAAFNLGEMYEKGIHFAQSEAPATEWYLVAAEHGHLPAQIKMVERYHVGKGTKNGPNIHEEIKWMEKCWDKGLDKKYCSKVGWKLHEGIGTPQNYPAALKWLQRGFDAGEATYAGALYSMYSQGRGVEKDFDKAKKYEDKINANLTSTAKNQELSFTGANGWKMTLVPWNCRSGNNFDISFTMPNRSAGELPPWLFKVFVENAKKDSGDLWFETSLPKETQDTRTDGQVMCWSFKNDRAFGSAKAPAGKRFFFKFLNTAKNDVIMSTQWINILPALVL